MNSLPRIPEQGREWVPGNIWRVTCISHFSTGPAGLQGATGPLSWGGPGGGGGAALPEPHGGGAGQEMWNLQQASAGLCD